MTSLQARLFGLIASLWGGLLVYFYHSGRIRRYLEQDFHQLILIGGIGILILGLFFVINPKDKSSTTCSHDHHHHDSEDHHQNCDHDHSDCEHDHDHQHDHCDHHHHDEGHGPLVTALLTLVPLTIAMAYTQDQYTVTGKTIAKKGLYEAPAINQTFKFTREDLEKRVPKNSLGEYQIRLITAYYAAGDKEMQPIFEGLPVELEGRIAPEKLNNEEGNRLRIFRSIISCCAADMQIIGISLDIPEDIERPKLNEWAKAGGTLDFEKINDTIYPVLRVRGFMPAEEPYSEFIKRQ